MIISRQQTCSRDNLYIHSQQPGPVWSRLSWTMAADLCEPLGERPADVDRTRIGADLDKGTVVDYRAERAGIECGAANAGGVGRELADQHAIDRDIERFARRRAAD